MSLLTRNKGTSVASLLLLILCGQRAPHFHGVSTDGSHPLSPKERAYLGNFTYTFTFLVDQKRGAQDLIYRWCFLKITHKMLVEKISTQWPSQIVLKASGWIAEWLCGHRARSWGQNQLPFSGPPPRARPLRTLETHSRLLVALGSPPILPGPHAVGHGGHVFLEQTQRRLG